MDLGLNISTVLYIKRGINTKARRAIFGNKPADIRRNSLTAILMEFISYLPS